jgi:hypothetical protein
MDAVAGDEVCSIKQHCLKAQPMTCPWVNPVLYIPPMCIGKLLLKKQHCIISVCISSQSWDP